MYTHLKERSYYQYLYDKHTVEDARHCIKYYEDFHAEFEAKLPKDETISRPGNALVLNLFYMQVVGNELCRRYEERDHTLDEWITRDIAKDERLADARLTEEPCCQHCNKQGLRIIDKSFMHRGKDYVYDAPEDVLFMLECPHCHKNSAFWEDGTVWKIAPTLCPKCTTEMTHTSKGSKKAITTTYSCPSCQHTYKEKLDLTTKAEEPDPDFDKDRIQYGLLDKEFREKLFEIRRGFQTMAELGKEWKEKEDNKHIYDAIKDLKKPKIAELVDILAPPLKEAGYIEFRLDQPEVGKDVIVGFSCLDSKTDRDDTYSRKVLKKAVETALQPTNWRLTSDGVGYRLGYLSGKLRAYETEEELKKLVENRSKLFKTKAKSTGSKVYKDDNGGIL